MLLHVGFMEMKLDVVSSMVQGYCAQDRSIAVA